MPLAARPAEAADPPAAAPAARPAPAPIGSAGAGEPGRIEQGSVPVTITVGSGSVLTTPSEIDRVALADETLARVSVLSRREVMLDGLAPGRTTLFLWLTDGRRLRYVVVVQRDLSLVERVVGEVDETIEVELTADGRSVILRGEVDSQAVAEAAIARAESALRMLLPESEKVHVLSLINYPEAIPAPGADQRLQALLAGIDSRIAVRRIQVEHADSAGTGDEDEDSYVLEGRVKTVADLMRAVTLTERQLGGTGNKLVAFDEPRKVRDRNQGFGGLGGLGGGSGVALSPFEPPPPGLASRIARGITLTSESGRVISFLEVDDLHQVQVAIRVLEIDRGRARTLGINYRVDANHFSMGANNIPGVSGLPSQRGEPASVSGFEGGNIVGAYVDSYFGIAATIDALENVSVARAVAEPNILTLSGEEASVLVGGELPIPVTTTNQVATVQGFGFREFGVRLDIRPTVADGDVIAMEVSPSIVRPTQLYGSNEVPGFRIESVQTMARVRAGQSLVIGGLLSHEDNVIDRKVPILGDIPIVNAAFRWQNKTRKETELLFVITPRLVGADGMQVPPELPEVSKVPRFDDPAIQGYTLEERRVYDPRNYQLAPPPAGAEQAKPR